MKLEDQVVSLELAKRMKELGFEQEGHFKYCGGHTFYNENNEGNFEVCDSSDLLEDDEYCHAAGLTCEFTIDAYTTDELLDIIPQYLIIENNDGVRVCANLQITKHPSVWDIDYGHYSFKNRVYLTGLTGESLADTLARMVIRLKEKGLI